MLGQRLCVPDVIELKKEIMEEAHSSAYAMHPGSTKMYQTLRDHYWWRGMKREIAEFVSKCLTCQQIKIEHQKPAGLLQPLSIPEWKWERITMYFVTGLPRTQGGHDANWVIVDRLTKSAHFIATNNTYSLERYARLYVDEIVRLHGAPVSIYRTKIPASLLDSGRSYKMLWAPDYISVLLFTNRHMANQREPFRLWRICLEHA